MSAAIEHCETMEEVVEATYRAMIDAFVEFDAREFARLREGEPA